jgi:hypothetical protein
MLDDRIKMAHYRLHSVEQWPESTLKQVTLAAIHATMEEFAGSEHICLVCQSDARPSSPQLRRAA